MKIRIYGASDDLIEVEGCDGADEFNSYEKGYAMWRGDLRAPNGEVMRAHAVLSNDGCWSIALGQANEVDPFPEWPVKIRQATHCDYSTMVEVDAPDGTVLENVWPSSGGDDD
jgi:hypothetical protein